MDSVDTDRGPHVAAPQESALEPDSIDVVDGVMHFVWKATNPGSTAVVVPGWGFHPTYYVPLIARLREHATVVSVWSEAVADRAGTRHYETLPLTLERLRDSSETGPFSIVAESLGCTYVLARASLRETDRVVLISPGLIPRFHQIASPRALADSWRLFRHNAMPIPGWRLTESSNNAEFLDDVRASGLTPDFAGRNYVLAAASAAVRAPFRRQWVERALVLCGGADKLLSPLGADLALRSLRTDRRDRKRLETYDGASHGLIWDAVYGPAVIERITEFLYTDD